MDNLEPITRNEMFLNGDDLEPITREEMILAGADLEPITRHEWFLKKYRGGGGGGGYDLVNIPNLPADIASFNDGTDLPMASLKVAVTPYQDLHGYDNPWVGGSGKNLLPMTVAKIKNINVTGTWSNNAYTKDGVVFTLLTDDGNNIAGINVNGTPPSGSYSQIYLVGEDDVYDYIGAQSGSYIISTTAGTIFVVEEGGTIVVYTPTNSTITIDSTKKYRVFIRVPSSVSNKVGYPMLRSASVADDTFAPYSNICPIIGWDEAVVTVADDVDNPTVEHEYTIDLNGTRYGGTLDATDGTFLDMIDHIASYNGETLPSTWISDRDVYAEGTTPTIGAEVVYPRATPITVQLAPQPVKSLEGVNNINANCGQITEVKYFKKA